MRNIENIKIIDIKVGQRKRTVAGNKVKELAESIKEVGLIQPIVLDEDNNLISGYNRIEAHKLLKLDEIAYIRIEGLSDLKKLLAEIDENLVRNDLHYIDLGNHLKDRKEIYEKLYPETRKGQYGGGKGENTKTKSESDKLSFSEDTAKKTSLSQRQIQRSLQIAENLPNEVKELVKTKDLPQKDALALARMDESEQKAVVERLETGKPITEKSDKAKMSPLKAIRSKCLDCKDYSELLVEECRDKNCPLHIYRLGKKITKADEQNSPC